MSCSSCGQLCKLYKDLSIISKYSGFWLSLIYNPGLQLLTLGGLCIDCTSQGPMRNLACLCIGDAAKNQGQWSLLSVWGCYTGNEENGRLIREDIKKQRTIKEWGIREEMREKYLLMGEWTQTVHLH